MSTFSYTYPWKTKEISKNIKLALEYSKILISQKTLSLLESLQVSYIIFLKKVLNLLKSKIPKDLL